VQWTGFILGLVLVVVHSVIVVVMVVLFVRSTEISFNESYWQTVAQVVSKETQPILEELDRMDDGAVSGRRGWNHWGVGLCGRVLVGGSLWGLWRMGLDSDL
jgi:hypothetical protein